MKKTLRWIAQHSIVREITNRPALQERFIVFIESQNVRFRVFFLYFLCFVHCLCICDFIFAFPFIYQRKYYVYFNDKLINIKKTTKKHKKRFTILVFVGILVSLANYGWCCYCWFSMCSFFYSKLFRFWL